MKDRVVLITNVEHFVGRPVAAELVGSGSDGGLPRQEFC